MTSRRPHEPHPLLFKKLLKNWRKSPERAELQAIYRDADAILAGYACDASTDCCRFGVTGREPYVTDAEVAEIELAILAHGGRASLKTTRRALAVAGERRCPMLDEAGKCTIYASRPLGCRTFFCGASLAKMDAKLPRAELQGLVRRIEELSERAFPDGEGTRPLTRALSSRLTK